MSHAFDHDNPEHMIAVLNRNRQIKLFSVLAGILLALTTMLIAAAAMYSADPAEKVLNTASR